MVYVLETWSCVFPNDSVVGQPIAVNRYDWEPTCYYYNDQLDEALCEHQRLEYECGLVARIRQTTNGIREVYGQVTFGAVEYGRI